MPEYTKLDKTQIKSILEQYSLGSINSITLLSGGSENTNYRLQTTMGDYVLTLCEQKSLSDARQLAEILSYLEQNNFHTSKIVVNNKCQAVTLWEDKPVMLKIHLSGSIRKELSKQILMSLGQQLAKLHLIKPPSYLNHNVIFGKESFKQIELYDNNSDFQKWLYSIRGDINEHIKHDLPKAFIHSDVFYNNVIIDDNDETATIMDFEEACFYYRVFDIGMMLVGLCEESNKLNVRSAQSVLAGYQQITQLNENEKQSLQSFSAYAAAATAFWRHKQFRYVMPDPGLHNHYLAMQQLGEDVLNIPKSIFKDILEYVA